MLGFRIQRLCIRKFKSYFQSIKEKRKILCPTYWYTSTIHLMYLWVRFKLISTTHSMYVIIHTECIHFWNIITTKNSISLATYILHWICLIGQLRWIWIDSFSGDGEFRQTGQVGWTFSHVSIHLRWKKWPHFGNNLITSVGL